MVLLTELFDVSKIFHLFGKICFLNDAWWAKSLLIHLNIKLLVILHFEFLQMPIEQESGSRNHNPQQEECWNKTDLDHKEPCLYLLFADVLEVLVTEPIGTDVTSKLGVSRKEGGDLALITR